MNLINHFAFGLLLVSSPLVVFAQEETVIKAEIIEGTDAEADRLYNSGIAQLKSKNYSAAIDDFTKAIVLKPEFALAFYNRGITYMEMNDHTQAIADFNASIQIDGNADSQFSKGRCQEAMGQFEDAMASYSLAIDSMNDYS